MHFYFVEDLLIFYIYLGFLHGVLAMSKNMQKANCWSLASQFIMESERSLSKVATFIQCKDYVKSLEKWHTGMFPTPLCHMELWSLNGASQYQSCTLARSDALQWEWNYCTVSVQSGG